MSRRVVTPLARYTGAQSTWLACACESHRPATMVFPATSTRAASAGTSVVFAGPTAVIRPFRMTTVASSMGVRPVPSTTRAPTSAKTPEAWTGTPRVRRVRSSMRSAIPSAMNWSRWPCHPSRMASKGSAPIHVASATSCRLAGSIHAVSVPHTTPSIDRRSRCRAGAPRSPAIVVSPRAAIRTTGPLGAAAIPAGRPRASQYRINASCTPTGAKLSMGKNGLPPVSMSRSAPRSRTCARRPAMVTSESDRNRR